MGKLLFFDIDGTLIECNKGIYSITNRTRESLNELKEKDHDVFLATGRCKCFILDGVYDYPFSGYVTCNGAYVEYKGEEIYKAVISSEALNATMELSNLYDFNYYFESNDFIYIKDKKDAKHIEFANNWGMKEQVTIDQFDPETIETYIGMIVVNKKEDIPIVVEKLSPYFDVQRHQSDFSFDLTLKGVSKAVGISELIKRLGRDMEDTIAFGDGRNDIEMLEEVGIGIAMGNAVPETKAISNYVTDSIVDEGITSALKHFGLIE